MASHRIDCVIACVVVEPSTAAIATRLLDGVPVWTYAWSSLRDAAAAWHDAASGAASGALSGAPSEGPSRVPSTAAQISPRTYVVAPPGVLPDIRAVVGPDAALDAGAGLPAVLRRLLDTDPAFTGLIVLDADRPSAAAALADDVHTALHRGAGLCLPLRPVVETLKQVDERGRILRTVPRDGVRHLQTPAGLSRAAVDAILRVAPPMATLADLLRLALSADPAASILPGGPRLTRVRPDQPGLSDPAGSLPASTASTAARSSG